MKKVVDKDGNIIEGMYRSDMGHLVIDDPYHHTKYLKAKQTVEETVALKNTVEELNKKVAMLIERLETNSIK